MEPIEIPQHNTETSASPETKIIRSNTPRLLVSLIEQGALENISSLSDLPSGSVTALEGGVSSACYFLENNGKPFVVKFRTWGVTAEAEALRRWGWAGVNVPRVIRDGIVDLDIGTKLPVKYIILEGITNKKGDIAPTATDLIVKSDENLEQLGREMGRQLFLIHQVRSDLPFGAFSDLPFKKFSLWNEYINNFIDTNKEYLYQIGVSNKDADYLIQKIKNIRFPIQGAYVHGDFGAYNVLVENDDPLSIKVFDPNPLIGDPYWDLAILINRMDLHTLKAKTDSSDGNLPTWVLKSQKSIEALLDSYTKHSGQELDQQRLLANLIGATIPKNLYHEKHNNTKDIELRRQLLRNYILDFVK